MTIPIPILTNTIGKIGAWWTHDLHVIKLYCVVDFGPVRWDHRALFSKHDANNEVTDNGERYRYTLQEFVWHQLDDK